MATTATRTRKRTPAPATKRIVYVGDSHVGGEGGILPPAYWPAESGPFGRLRPLYAEMWAWWQDFCRAIQPVHAVVIGGDCVDGDQVKDGGLGLVLPDRIDQARVAADLYKPLRPRQGFRLVEGSAYHAGKRESFDALTAYLLGAEYVRESKITANGCCIYSRHKPGGKSGTPVGGDISLKKQDVWNDVKFARGKQDLYDFMIFHHVHELRGVTSAWKQVWTCPAMSAARGKFGEVECSGDVQFGALWIDVDSKGKGSISWEVKRLEGERLEAWKL